jgi:DMSO/TMAO reductase YedYZ molybdopterin-dependent catalytic subunit
MRKLKSSRRSFLKAGLAGFGVPLLAGCNRADAGQLRTTLFDTAEQMSYRVQRFLIGGTSLAREFSESDISPNFKANGTTDPQDEDYLKLVENNFADWTLKVDGLVDRPLSFTLADLKAMPARTQITRHDCVEGWSCIGKWTGTPLSLVLDKAGVQPSARFVVFHCADSMDDSGSLDGTPPKYYESIDLVDARHPQTILAYAMNDQPLPVAHGAPLRVRIERQLGYKSAKYLLRIELVEHYRTIGDGNGGYWEDNGYDWYAGI